MSESSETTDTPFKHFWIWGPSGIGKTRFFKETLPFMELSCYKIPSDGDHSKWEDQAYDYALLDSAAQHSLRYLNEWLGGSRMVLRCKSGSKIKNENIPTFVLSNVSPHMLFELERVTQPTEFKDLISKLHVLYVAESLDLSM